MNVLRTIKIKNLNGQFTEKEKSFFSKFDNLVEEENAIKKLFGPKGGHALFIYNKWTNIFWMDFGHSLSPFLKRYNLHPLEGKKMILKMLKMHLRLDARLSSNLPDEFETYYDDFCNDEA